jgi:hypothetical protein
MRIIALRISLSLVLIIGCSRPTRTGPVPQVPVPVIPAPVPGVQAPQSWSFNYQAGIAAYQIVRNATIESITDSLSPGVIDSSSNTAHEVLSLERIGDTTQFTLALDTFATTIPGRAGAPQPTELPVQIKGWMTRDSLIVAADSASSQCNPIKSAAESDLHTLVVQLPVILTPGLTWQDSVDMVGCQSLIPTAIHISRFFRVIGETPSGGAGIVVVERSDSIRAHGEGAQQQHRVVLDATGDGTTLYYLSTSDGRLVRANTDQRLNIGVVTSENAGHFRQTLKQEIALIR